jgi:hypothetical protein
MLKTLDILIGVSVVMLVVSLIVTVVTQAVIQILQTRGKYLLAGITELLGQIHPQLQGPMGNAIARAVLTHPLISAAEGKLGSAIHREELTHLLLDLAAGQGLQKLPPPLTAALQQALQENGIPDPVKTIESVRALELQLERTNPEMATDARHSLALLHEADSAFLAKMNGWFDQTVDRVSDRFTTSAHVLTVIGSFVVALVLQLDTMALINRLGSDQKLRQTLVQQAIQWDQQNSSPSQNKPAAAVLSAGNVVPAAQANGQPAQSGRQPGQTAPESVQTSAQTASTSTAPAAATTQASSTSRRRGRGRRGSRATPATTSPTALAANSAPPGGTGATAPPRTSAEEDSSVPGATKSNSSPTRPALAHASAAAVSPGQGNAPVLFPPLTAADRQNLQELMGDDLVDFPKSVGDWFSRWTLNNALMKLLGILVTAMLLSLGAPFWYNALKNLIRLRSVVAAKDDVQRDIRQSAGPADDSAEANASSAAAAVAANPAWLAGERGDLTSVG